MAKRRAEASREGEVKPFVVSAVIKMVKKTHGQLQRQGHTASVGPALLTNQMLESIEVYLYNIAMAATQTVAKVEPLAELAASLAISVDTVARQQ